jgi:hypothetical protein
MIVQVDDFVLVACLAMLGHLIVSDMVAILSFILCLVLLLCCSDSCSLELLQRVGGEGVEATVGEIKVLIVKSVVMIHYGGSGASLWELSKASAVIRPVSAFW